ncbi:AsmA-like C-terminal region-containing protein [Flavobacterium sp. 7A]|uniref:AsmA-like C-terminal region-containing protein n=1 Tax=Flavobacterium sp. 7A TaxID=2940571 RepID=UPI002227B24A|nr:AsmA-like C-terminal region-containing protein [Flavobacterium sp. 7A]MCW2121099.1 AsmA protein [Flavobacterium sp. 7A]
MKSYLIKGLKITGITLFALLALMFLLPKIFPEFITNQIKIFANENIEGELGFKESNLSFFDHFPSLTLTLNDFNLKGAAPYKNETLISAQEMAFGINISRLIFNKEVKIDQIFVSNAIFNIKVNEQGQANYSVYKSKEESSTETESSSTSIKLEKIDIKNTKVVYNDESTKIIMEARGFNYIGKGDLEKSVFDLVTEAKINSFDFSFGGEQYLKNKQVNAALITKINTTSLAFEFKQNDLKINNLPVDFKGTFNFIKDGYAMNFVVKSTDSNLYDFFTALPPQFTQWLSKTKIEGKTDVLLTLKGDYIQNKNKKPDLGFNMKIRKGMIAYDKVPVAASNLFLNFDTKLPSLDTKLLNVKIDSIYFNLGKEYLNGILDIKGLKKPIIAARLRANMDLEKMNRAFGISKIDLRGVLYTDISANGVYDMAGKILPKTKGFIHLNKGMIKTPYYPNPITDINLDLKMDNPVGTTKALSIQMNPASFIFEGKPVKVEGSFGNLDDIHYDLKVNGEMDLGKIYKVFSQKGLDVKGYIKANLALKGSQSDASNGRYSKLKNSGTLLLRNITTHSQYLPKAFVINEGLFTFKQDQLHFKNFTASYGKSDFVMNGMMNNVINFVLSDKAVLKGSFAIKSKNFYVDEFLFASPDPIPVDVQVTSSAVGSGVIVIPPNLNLNLAATATKVYWQGLTLLDLVGNLNMNKAKVTLKDSGFKIIGSPVKMDIVYNNETMQRAFFDFKIKAEDFDIKRAYDEIEMFRNMASAAKSAQGIVSLDYAVRGKLDQDMKPIYSSLSGGGILSVKDVKMKGFKMFNNVSKSTSFEGIKDPNVTKVDINTTIKNNIITIDQFKFKFAGFRPRIEGTSSFDGRLNIKMRLGLPPLGIIGIPLTVTGTQEDPKVKLGKKSEEIEEQEYIENPIK